MRERRRPAAVLPRLPGLLAGLVALGIGPLVQGALGIFDREGRIARRERMAIGEPGSMTGE